MSEQFYTAVAQVLRVEQARPQDNFFALGGDSLAAAKLVMTLRRQNVTIELTDVFRHATLADLWSSIDGRARSADPAAPAPAPATRPAADQWRVVNANQAARLQRIRTSVMEMKSGWSTLSHLITVGFAIRGPLDVARLRTAVEVVAARHSALRSRFEWSAETRQQVTAHSIGLEVVDHAGDCSPALVTEPFDLGAGPLARFVLVRHGDDGDHADFWLAVEHMVADGFSVDLLLGELSDAYRDPGAVAHRPVVQGYEHAEREEAYCRSERGRAAEEYWVAKLDGKSPWLGLDYPGWTEPSPEVRSETTWCTATLAAADNDRLSAVCQTYAVTAFAVILAALAEAVHERTGLTTAPVLTPVQNRWDPDFESVVTFAASVSPIPVAATPTGAAADRLTATQAAVVEAITHAPFGMHRYTRLHAPEEWGRPQTRPYLYLDVNPQSGDGFALDGTTITALPQPPAAIILGVALWVTYGADGIELHMGHPRQFLPDGELEKLFDAFRASLARLLALPTIRGGDGAQTDMPARPHSSE